MDKLGRFHLWASPDAIPALASVSPDWPALERLDVILRGEGPWSFPALDNAAWGHIQTLRISTSCTGLPAPTHLLGLDALPALTDLEISVDPKAAPGTIQALAACKLPALQRLSVNVRGEHARGEGVAGALAAAEFPALEALELHGPVFDSVDEAMQFATAPWLPRLPSLHIMPHSAENPGFTELHLALIMHACRNGALEKLFVEVNPYNVMRGLMDASLPRPTSLSFISQQPYPIESYADINEWERISKQYGNATVSIDLLMAVLFSHTNFPALRRLELYFSALAPRGGYYWNLVPEEYNPNVFPDLQLFITDNLRVLPSAGIFLAATVAGGPSLPFHAADVGIDHIPHSEEQMAAELAIQERFSVGEDGVWGAIVYCRWGDAYAVRALSLMDYKAAALTGKVHELGRKYAAGTAVTEEAGQVLAIAATNPELLPENQRNEIGQKLVREAREALQRMAQGSRALTGDVSRDCGNMLRVLCPSVETAIELFDIREY